MSADRHPTTDEAALATAANWLSRLTGGAATSADWDRFTEWLYASPRHMAAMDLIEQGWRGSGELAERPAILAERRRARGLRVAGPQTRPSRTPWRPWATALAGAGTLALVGLVLATLFPPANYGTSRTYASARGQQLDAQLPDGSLMRLNTDTRVTITYGWFGRDLTLDRGEAEFTVAHGDHRPFTVSDGRLSVRATGTIFTVRDLPGGMRVFLAEGGVQVRQQEAGQVLGQLTPGQVATVTDGGRIQVAAADLTAENLWREGKVAFDGTPLSAALAEFSRYSPVAVELRPGLETLRVSGMYRTTDLVPFLNAVSRLHRLRWEQTAPGQLSVEPAA